MRRSALSVLACGLVVASSGCVLKSFELEESANGAVAGAGTAGVGGANAGSAGIGGLPEGTIRISSPHLLDDYYVVAQGSSLSRDASGGLLANDTPVNLRVASIDRSDVDRPAAYDAELAVQADGSFVFTPAASFFGSYRITYRAQTVKEMVATAKVEIRVVPRDIELDVLADSIGGYVIYGPRRSGFGSALDRVFDANRDGRDDMVVGAPLARSGDGTAYVIFGKDDRSPLDVEPLSASSVEERFVSLSAGRAESLGASVCGPGDVDGDGAGDVLVGAPGAGRAYFVSARDLAAGLGLPSAHGLALVGDSADVDAGSLVRRAGDVNGDGVAELLVSTSDANSGWLHVLFGGTFDGEESALASAAGFHVRGSAAAAFPLAAAGGFDLDGDGASELFSASSDHFYLFRGGASLTTDPAQLRVDGSHGGYSAARLTSGPADVASLGDVNRDGAPDIAYCDGVSACYVVLGPVATLANALRVSGFARRSARLLVSGAGDFDGDGIDDMLFADPSTAYLVYGRRAGLSELQLGQLGDGGLRVRAVSGGSFSALAALGDVNADGFDDIGFGDASADSAAGRVYVLLGGPAH